MKVNDLKHHLSDSTYSLIQRRIVHLERFMPLRFEFSKFDSVSKTIVMAVQQHSKWTDEEFTPSDMTAFTRPFVDVLEQDGWTVHINCRSYEADSAMSDISATWLRQMLDERNLSQSKLARDLGVDRFTISRMLNNKTAFTKWAKAALYYYFHTSHRPYRDEMTVDEVRR